MSRKKTHEEYVTELAIKNPNVEVVESYKGARVSILHRCKIHNITWLAPPTNILRGCGCYICGNNMKKKHEQYIQEVAIINPFIDVIGEYINSREPIKHRCKIDDHTWLVAPYVILRGDGCPKCAGNAKKTTYDYINELKNINCDIEVVDEYINANTPILHRCKIDGNVWSAAPANILSGRGCPECKFRILANTFMKTHEEYVNELNIYNPDIEVVEKYLGASIPILHRCKKDGYMWKIAPSNALIGQGCPQCHESNGERRVRQWLEKNHLEYVYQKTFVDCKHTKTLPFDFYLPKYDVCIEYDGEQHYEPVDFAGKGQEWANNKFLITKQHDDIKTQYCKNNDIHLLRIPYYSNVEEELDNFLFI